jgi:hypothetical protein
MASLFLLEHDPSQMLGMTAKGRHSAATRGTARGALSSDWRRTASNPGAKVGRGM